MATRHIASTHCRPCWNSLPITLHNSMSELLVVAYLVFPSHEYLRRTYANNRRGHDAIISCGQDAMISRGGG